MSDTTRATMAIAATDLALGLADRSDRARLEIHGPDRAKFLHNLTTNDIKRLAAGRGCEAFVTTLQGKTIAYVVILATDDHLLVLADAGGLELALPHMRKYGVFDDVSIEDVSGKTFELHLAGIRADELARQVMGDLPDNTPYAHVLVDLAGHAIRVVRETPLGVSGLTFIGASAAFSEVRERLLTAGAGLGLSELERATAELLRIEAGTPVFGKDISDRNFPQEIGRDNRAISFIKGCYLGQETVARIDAVGHVNQILKGVWIASSPECPAPGWVLTDGDKRVGVITSTAAARDQNTTVALALVRTTHARAGTVVRVGPADAESVVDGVVSDLPMARGPVASAGSA